MKLAQHAICNMQISSYAIILLKTQCMIARLSNARSAALVLSGGWGHWYFCISENSGKNTVQAFWGLSAFLSRARQPQISHRLPVSWCNLLAIQLSIKISVWIAVFCWFSLQSKLRPTKGTRLGKCLKRATPIWKNCGLFGCAAVVFACSCISS